MGLKGFEVLQDNSRVGIRATLSKLSDMLQQEDEELWNHVQIKNKVCFALPYLYSHAKHRRAQQTSMM